MEKLSILTDADSVELNQIVERKEMHHAPRQHENMPRDVHPTNLNDEEYATESV